MDRNRIQRGRAADSSGSSPARVPHPALTVSVSTTAQQPALVQAIGRWSFAALVLNTIIGTDPGDTDTDLDVDLSDLAVLLANFGM